MDNQNLGMILGAVLLIGIVTFLAIRAMSAGKRSEERSGRVATRQQAKSDRLFQRRAFRGRQGRRLARELYFQQQQQAQLN